MRIFGNIILFLFLSPNLFAQNDSMLVVPVRAVNSVFQDYAPLFLDSTTMLFTSSRPNPIAERNMSNNHNIYISHKQGDFWSAPKLISYLSNSDNHEATAGISSDRKTVFIYKTFNGGNIYYSVVKGQTLNALKKAPFNTQWHESSACFSANTLFFVSDMPGGKGNHDIYYCTAKDFGWSEPVNLGSLNTDKDENYVSVSSQGDTLYFSSKGHNSLGGYDIFRSVCGSDNQWSEPQNLGKLINTTYDEICFTTDPSGIMYFSSDKPDSTNTGFNIYSCIEKKIKAKVPLGLIGSSPLVVSKTGTVELIKEYIEVECYKRFLPEKIEVDITNVIDTSNIILIGDLKVDKHVSVLDNKEEAVIGVKKLFTKLENLTLDEVKKNIDFEINYCAVQVGAFTWKTSITDFAKDFPLLGDKVLMIHQENFNRFVMRETFEELDSAIALQKKCITEYHSVKDTFVAVYDMHNKRMLIYFDYAKNSFMMLRPEDQYQDDVLFK